MVKWKFKTFILIYSIICLGVIIYICNYVWNGLEKYQADYDREYRMSKAEMAMDEYIETLSLQTILDAVKTSPDIKLSAYETIDSVLKLYETNYEKTSFSYKEDKSVSSSSKKVFDINDNKENILSVTVESKERTKNFGFDVWKVTDVTLSKLYEPEYSIKLRVTADSEVTINGVGVNADENCKIYDDEKYDKEFAKEVKIYAKEYDTYKYYEISGLYYEPDIQVKDGEVIDKYVLTDDGVRDYEKVADTTFIDSIKNIVIDAETVYAEFFVNRKSWTEVTSLLIPGSTLYDQTNQARSYMVWVSRPYEVFYENWEILDVKKLSDEKFICNVKYTQRASYSEDGKSVMKKYDIDNMVLFIKDGAKWKIAYRKNKQTDES